MTASDRSGQARIMVDYIDVVLEFADQRQDYVLAARLEDIKERLKAHGDHQVD